MKMIPNFGGLLTYEQEDYLLEEALEEWREKKHMNGKGVRENEEIN